MSDRQKESTTYRDEENADKRRGGKAPFMRQTAIPGPPTRVASTFAQPPPLAYTVRAAVAASGLSRSRLYELISAGLLPVVRIGKRVLIRHQDLAALIDSHLTKPRGKAA
jgi:excisionase family DNA binding protein